MAYGPYKGKSITEIQKELEALGFSPKKIKKIMALITENQLAPAKK
jgi:uncharacterized protein (UPF0335 family)